jgi:hypothetical protein
MISLRTLAMVFEDDVDNDLKLLLLSLLSFALIKEKAVPMQLGAHDGSSRRAVIILATEMKDCLCFDEFPAFDR